jgi:hypothetical protein
MGLISHEIDRPTLRFGQQFTAALRLEIILRSHQSWLLCDENKSSNPRG